MKGAAPRRREMSRWESATIGALCGSIEMCIMRPTVYWKAELQQGRFSLARAVNPIYAYRGTFIAASSIAPITAIQFSVNAAVKDKLSAMPAAGSAPKGEEASAPFVLVASSATAGVASALVQSPCQLVEINQQKHGGTMVAMAKRVLGEYGPRGFFRGLSMTMAREGIFCTSYMATSPLLAGRLREDLQMEKASSEAAGAVLAGTAGATLTHPADTLKTRIQGDLFAPLEEPNRKCVHTSVRASIAHLCKSSDGIVRQCYQGYLPRVFRIVCCTFIYGQLQEVFERAADGWR